ncbi:formyltetrahydrofolate deformylase [Conexibacter arvalis]|uniref:Formyltetrahydrofolate deformylase n=1 Tax=Conexibacter arvalis TaxID=912552 RepID=A0A840ICE2_9ACTN|nr:formyltetrahydrofolate deformylase [Conexibacter arvalis]MBB4662607.1 formyltetrahydrofolate deformylase [Conexibacter arvalis]
MASTGDTATRGRPNTARLLISCADRRGIVAAVSRFLFDHGANILDADQHTTDPEGGTFFMRMEFHLEGLDVGGPELERSFAERVGEPFGMEWRIAYACRPKRVALLVSREEHCLLDLLWRWRRGDLDAEIALVLSNHRDAERDVRGFEVPFAHVPVERGRKPEAEAAMLALLREHGPFDLVVLARYMQILSGDFLAAAGAPLINIHHSFLPAFAGADPYQRASERGVKIIGATAHYVTEELDAGPIIEQDVAHVSHRDDVPDLVRIGRDIERTVLARAVARHLADRVLVHENKTVVF